MGKQKNKMTVHGIGAVKFIIPFLVFTACTGNTPAVRDILGNCADSSIGEITELNIQGYEQYLVIRGLDRDAPVLLVLHGGPGFSELPLMRSRNADLEKHFVVVYWEQPGAGKSYRRDYFPGFIDGNTLVACGLDVTEYLQNRFGKQKIYLLGHCMGTILGMEMIRRNPLDFQAYIGVTQHVCLRRNLSVSYEYLRDEYDENERASAELESIESLFSLNGGTNYFSDEEGESAAIYGKWLERSGEFYYGEKSTPATYRNLYLHAREYTLFEKMNIAKGPFLMRPVAESWIDLDYSVECPEVEVPVWFIMGAHDAHVRSEVTREWFDELQAPTKTFLEYENSAHFPHLEEAERFNQLMIEILEDSEAD